MITSFQTFYTFLYHPKDSKTCFPEWVQTLLGKRGISKEKMSKSKLLCSQNIFQYEKQPLKKGHKKDTCSISSIYGFSFCHDRGNHASVQVFERCTVFFSDDPWVSCGNQNIDLPTSTPKGTKKRLIQEDNLLQPVGDDHFFPFHNVLDSKPTTPNQQSKSCLVSIPCEKEEIRVKIGWWNHLRFT